MEETMEEMIPAEAESPEEEMEYVGFWARVGASLIDTLLVAALTWPVLTAYYGASYWLDDKLFKGPLDFVLSFVFPVTAVVAFWICRQASPGKMARSARIVDAKTGGKPSAAQCVGRYFGYIVAMLPFCVGILWVAFDKRKQGWHDKLAGTVVIRPKKKTADVAFEAGE